MEMHKPKTLMQIVAKPPPIQRTYLCELVNTATSARNLEHSFLNSCVLSLIIDFNSVNSDEIRVSN